MFYVIKRGYKDGKPLTPAQRISPLFAEEPRVLGKILRRGGPPMKLSEAEFKRVENDLRRLENAGAIEIEKSEGTMQQEGDDESQPQQVMEGANPTQASPSPAEGADPNHPGGEYHPADAPAKTGGPQVAPPAKKPKGDEEHKGMASSEKTLAAHSQEYAKPPTPKK